MSSNAPLAGQAALVTGAAGGIGRAIAERMDAAGANVVLVGRNAEALEQVKADHALRVVTDLTSDEQLQTAVNSALGRLRRLDILVHCNGIHLAGPLVEHAIADFDRLWAANVRSPFLLTQLVLPALRQSAGQIVFVNSSTGLQPRPGVGLFSATQHALRALAEVFRAEVNQEGIRVLNVYPGRTATERQARIYREEGQPYDPARLLQPADIAELVLAALVAPRTAEVTDIRIRPLLKPT